MKQIISIIVAMNIDNVIGVDNQLPWHISEDLKHFKELTINKSVIMGRKTFESIGRPLPNRHNIVITRNRGWVANDVTIAASLDDAMSLCSDSPEICIIGGGEVFEQGLLIANELHITIVDVKVNNPTVFFPKIDYNNWKLINEESIVSSGGVSCHFKDYIRI